MNTNSTRILTVGTVKKSIATISPRWFWRKVFQVCDGGRLTVRRIRETVRSEILIPSLSKLAVNARRTPQRIRPSHGLNQIADRLANRWPSHLPTRLAGQLCPIPTETLPLPANDRIWVHQNQALVASPSKVLPAQSRTCGRNALTADACCAACRQPIVDGAQGSPGRGLDGLW